MTRDQFQQKLASIKDSRFQENCGDSVLEEVTALVEQVVREAFQNALARVAMSPAGVSILATGGFGRRELHPYSDVDIILLFERPLDSADEEFLKAFLHPLWDLGLNIGHHVLQEKQYRFDSQNLELATALLDIRLIAGEQRLFLRFRDEELPEVLGRARKEMLRVLVSTVNQRHKRFNETIYQLEPDVKESPGGLRDYQAALWIGRILFGATSFEDFIPRQLFSAEELEQIQKAHRFLLSLRNDLHFLSGRNRNILSHELQAQLALLLGHGTEGDFNVEGLMKGYFLWSKVIYGFCGSMIRRAFPPARRIARSFKSTTWSTTVVRRGALEFSDERSIVDHPANMLKLFYRSAKYQIPVSERALDEVKRHLSSIDSSVRASGEVRDLFFKLLRQPKGVYRSLVLMHEIGLLGQIFPEFDRIRCHVIQDFFHRYTVDEHSLLTIKNLEDLYHVRRPRDRRFGGILKSLPRPELVLFAMLFHDVGKADPGNHCDNSVLAVEQVARRLRLPEEDIEKIRFLIQHHLEMSLTFQRRDVTDEGVVKKFADFIGTQENLRMLCLVTYADIRAVSPEALTPWKEDILWQLYVETEAQLTRGFADDRGDTLHDSSLAQEVTQALMNPDPTLVSRVQVFLDGFPRRYLRFTSKQKIGEHFKLAEKVRSPDDLVLKLNRSRSTYELTLVALDRPYLFAKLTGVLSYFGMNIVRGQAFAYRQGIVLDIIQFEDRLQTFRLNKSEIDHFRQKLHQILNDQESLTELLRSRENSILLSRKAKRPLSTFVNFDDHASEKYSIMEIITQDRYGLLSKIAKVFAQNDCNIDVALISTEGHRAIDVFYLTQNGARLTGQKRERLAALMKEALDQAA